MEKGGSYMRRFLPYAMAAVLTGSMANSMGLAEEIAGAVVYFASDEAAYFFITYTLLNAVFYTANNIAYASLTALITKNGAERVQLGSFRFMFAYGTSMLIQAITIGVVEALGGGAAGCRKLPGDCCGSA